MLTQCLAPWKKKEKVVHQGGGCLNQTYRQTYCDIAYFDSDTSDWESVFNVFLSA